MSQSHHVAITHIFRQLTLLMRQLLERRGNKLPPRNLYTRLAKLLATRSEVS